MYKERVLEDGNIELSWEGETVKQVLGIYTPEELQGKKDKLRKEEDRQKFLKHIGKNRRHET